MQFIHRLYSPYLSSSSNIAHTIDLSPVEQTFFSTVYSGKCEVTMLWNLLFNWDKNASHHISVTFPAQCSSFIDYILRIFLHYLILHTRSISLPLNKPFSPLFILGNAIEVKWRCSRTCFSWISSVDTSTSFEKKKSRQYGEAPDRVNAYSKVRLNIEVIGRPVLPLRSVKSPWKEERRHTRANEGLNAFNPSISWWI